MPSVIEVFETHVSSVEKLMNFDRDVLAIAISSIEELQRRLKHHHKLDNPALTAERTLDVLRGLRKNDSLRPRYEVIFNQALVLLVSYFASSVGDLFRRAIAKSLTLSRDIPLLDDQVRVGFRELREANFEVRDLLPDLIILSRDISFQDMQSIARAFRECLGVQIEKTTDVNDIIAGQACRHVIVHSGGVVDEKLMRQLRAAIPRHVKAVLAPAETLQFSVDEVMAVAASMQSYIHRVTGLIKAELDFDL